MTGGKTRDKMVGADQLLLSVVLYIYPNASLDKLYEFVVANGGHVYSRQQISRRCLKLVTTRKRSSREVYDTFSVDSINKLE